MMNYGLVSIKHGFMIAKAVSACLGNGKNNNADLMSIRTAAAETQFGLFKDNTPDGAGRGVTQVDADTFYWLKEKALELAPGACMRTKRNWRERIINDFGIDLKRVEHADLDYNPLLSFIFTRLRYLVVTEEIPTTLEGQAHYWKKHYNSSLGKGTIEHFIESVEKLPEISL